MKRVIILTVLWCCSATYGNIYILSRNVDTNSTTLTFDEEEITGPFITVGEEIIEQHQNSSNAIQDSNSFGDPDDPDSHDEENYDDYDFGVGHLHAFSLNSEDATEPRPGNFPNRRHKNSKKRPKNPKRPKRPKDRIRRPLVPVGEKRKRIRIRNDQNIKPTVVSQFVDEQNSNCPRCRCGIQVINRNKNRRTTTKIELPWLVHLSYFGRLYCAGVLINDRYVITAGHCTKGYITKMITVRLLEYEQVQQFGTSDIERIAIKVYRPPTYNPETLEDNIALIKINPPAPIEKVPPICLPLKGSSFAGKNGFVAGWGMTQLRNNEASSVLRRAVVPIISNKSCRRTLPGQDISRRMMCAGHQQTRGLDACQVLSRNDSTPTIIPPLKDYQSIRINETHDLGLMLNNESYHLLLPNSFLGNASSLDALTEEDLKFINEADAINELELGSEKFGISYQTDDEEYEDEAQYSDEHNINSNNNNKQEVEEEEEEEEGEPDNDFYDETNYQDEQEDFGFKATANATRAKRQCPSCQCGIRNVRRIVGGKLATRYLYPWTVILRYGSRFYCGGSLITDMHVVTAGHCTDGLSVKKITAGFLQHDLQRPERGIAFSRKIASYRRHKRYNPKTLEHDIAILNLAKRVPIGSSLLRPICLPDSGENFVGRKGYIAGWGAVGEWSMPSTKLRHAVVPVISNKRCRQTAYGNDIKKSMICAGFPKKGQIDACQGDSGGPLMVPRNKRYYLAGVISWGDGCARRNHPGVYSRVANYINWIRNRSTNACRCSS